MKLKKSELKEFLDEKVELYNRPAFIEPDPFKSSAAKKLNMFLQIIKVAD